MNISDSLKGILKTVAPAIATSLGGPLAGAAAKFVSDKLGVNVEELEGYLTSNHEHLREMRKLDLEWEKFKAENNIKEFELEVKSTDSARGLAKERGMVPQIIIASIVFILYAGITYNLMSHVSGGVAIDPQLALLVGAVFGAITTAMTQIINFFFGSSRGSKDKSEQMAALVAEVAKRSD